VGIQGAQAADGGIDLGAADVGRGVQDLALQVGDLHLVGIHEAEEADAGGGEVVEGGRAEAAAADDQHAPGAELFLGMAAEPGQVEVAGVALRSSGEKAMAGQGTGRWGRAPWPEERIQRAMAA
jgi:hypothetical protein